MKFSVHFEFGIKNLQKLILLIFPMAVHPFPLNTKLYVNLFLYTHLAFYECIGLSILKVKVSTDSILRRTTDLFHIGVLDKH